MGCTILGCWGLEGSLVVKSTCFFCREFSSQHPQVGQQLFVSIVTEDLMSFLASVGARHTCSAQIHIGKIPKYIKYKS